MKKSLFVFTLILFSLSIPKFVDAKQTGPGVPVHLLANIDTVNVEGGYINGWSFSCFAGGNAVPVASVSFLSLDGKGWWVPSYYGLVAPVFRPDVQAAYAASCQGVSAYSGWWLYPQWPPAGRWLVYIVFAQKDGATQIYRATTVTVR